MTTVEEALTEETSFLGDGGTRFWAWYPAAVGTPWCCIFQSYCLTAIGIPTHFSWVSGLFDDYRTRGLFTSTEIRQAVPGDLVAFEWGTTPGGYDHIAMIETVTDSGCWTLNGNVNGSTVARIFFSFDSGGMAEIARPPYSTTPTPSPEDDEMATLILVDRRKTPAPAYHAFGNTKVWLSSQAQVDYLVSVGVRIVDPANPAWLDSLATLPRNDGLTK
jgi:CHAP domain